MTRVNGLNFIVPVRNMEAAAKFYCEAFDFRVVFQNEHITFVGVPGTEVSMGLLLDPENAGSGPQNVGLHVDHAVEHDAAVRDVEASGGRVVERGEHAPGVPFARIADPDGNIIEI